MASERWFIELQRAIFFSAQSQIKAKVNCFELTGKCTFICSILTVLLFRTEESAFLVSYRTCIVSIYTYWGGGGACCVLKSSCTFTFDVTSY